VFEKQQRHHNADDAADVRRGIGGGLLDGHGSTPVGFQGTGVPAIAAERASRCAEPMRPTFVKNAPPRGTACEPFRAAASFERRR
jgi:hypothetical protein